MLIGTVFATIYLQDNFNDGSFTDKWNIGTNCLIKEESGYAQTPHACNLYSGYRSTGIVATGGSSCFWSKNSFSFGQGMNVQVELTDYGNAYWASFGLSNEDYSPMSDHRRYRIELCTNTNLDGEDSYTIYAVKQKGTTFYTVGYDATAYTTGTMKISRTEGDEVVFYWRGTEFAREDWDIGESSLYVMFGSQSAFVCEPHDRNNPWQQPYLTYKFYTGIAKWDNLQLWD